MEMIATYSIPVASAVQDLESEVSTLRVFYQAELDVRMSMKIGQFSTGAPNWGRITRL